MSSTVSAGHAEPAPYPSAGVSQMEVADAGAPRFPVIVLYPSAATAAPVKLGQYTEILAADGPVAPGKHRLVVVSHGSGGTPLTHRLLAATLARHGNVVALIEHPGNNRNDNRLKKTPSKISKAARGTFQRRSMPSLPTRSSARTSRATVFRSSVTRWAATPRSPSLAEHRKASTNGKSGRREGRPACEVPCSPQSRHALVLR